MTYAYIPITIDRSVLEQANMRPGDSMPKDPLDRPITLRELVDAMEPNNTARPDGAFRKTVNALVKNATETDFVKVQLSKDGWARRYVYRIAEMPARRVQVGDLVTTQKGFGTGPTVGRVVEINVPAPEQSRAVAVAISPEDASRIEKALGPVGP